MQSEFLGFFPLGGTLNAPVEITDGSGVPTDPAIPPTYRVYDGRTLNNNGTSATGSLAQTDTGTISAATNASPIAVTSAAHNLQTGNRVTVTNVGGNTAANGTFSVTRTGANTFTLDGSTGNGGYTSGGAWHITGLYLLTLSLTAGNGYVAGKVYTVLLTWTVSSVVYSKLVSFVVV